jgi:hypothetical protein
MLVMLTTLDGTPYASELVPGNTDEYEAADEVLDYPSARQQCLVRQGLR